MPKATNTKNISARAQRHAKRLAAQAHKRIGYDMEDGSSFPCDLKVPRGTARALRRKPLQEAYAKRQSIEARLSHGAEA